MSAMPLAVTKAMTELDNICIDTMQPHEATPLSKLPPVAKLAAAIRLQLEQLNTFGERLPPEGRTMVLVGQISQIMFLAAALSARGSKHLAARLDRWSEETAFHAALEEMQGGGEPNPG